MAEGPNAATHPRVADPRSSGGGVDLSLVDKYLALVTGHVGQERHKDTHTQPRPPLMGGDMPAGALEAYRSASHAHESLANLAALQLDPRSLAAQGVPPHHARRLYSALHAHALAFQALVSDEQARLGVMVSESHGMTMSDRVLAFATGQSASLVGDGTAFVRNGGTSTGAGTGTSMHGSSSSSSSTRPGTARPASVAEAIAPPVPRARPATARPGTSGAADHMSTAYGHGPVMLTEEERRQMLDPGIVFDVDAVNAAASAGNVVGLQRLLMQYRASYQVRQRQTGSTRQATR